MASNSIGNLSIVISGNASGLTKALSTAQQQLQSFNRQATATSSIQPKFLDRQFGRLGRSFSNDAMESKSLQRMWDQLQRGVAARGQLPAAFQKLVGQTAPKFTIPPPPPGLASRVAGGFSQVGGAAGRAFSAGWDMAKVGWGLAMSVKDGLGIAVGFAASAGAAIKHSLEKAMDFQDLLVSFEVMTGSATQGRQMLETLERFSATLPFTQGSVMKAARTLAGNGVALENVLPALRSIATVVAGTGGDDERFGNMVLAFSQVTSMGKLMGQELRQLNDAGFTIDNIARAIGTDAGEVRKIMETGAISTMDVYRAFNMAVGPGGKFDGLLDRQAQTTRGRIRRLMSEISIAERKVGEGFRQAIDNSGLLEVGLGAMRTFETEIPNLQAKLAGAGHGIEDTFVRIAAIAGSIADEFTPVANTLTQNVIKPLTQVVVMLQGLRAMFPGGGGGGGDGGGDGIGGGIGGGIWSAMKGHASDLFGLGVGLKNPAIWLGKKLGTLIPGGTGNRTPFATPEGQAVVDAIAAAQIPAGGNRAEEWAKQMRDRLAAFKEMMKPAPSSAMQAAGVGFAAVLKHTGDGLLDIRAASWRLSEDLEKLRKKVEETAAEGFTPFDKFQRQMEQLSELAATPLGGPGVGRNAGMGLGFAAVGLPNQINQFQADFMRREAFLEIERGMDKFKDEFPKAMERGSVDAASAINRALYQTGQESIEARVLRVLEMQKKNGDTIKDETKRIGDAIVQWQAAGM